MASNFTNTMENKNETLTCSVSSVKLTSWSYLNLQHKSIMKCHLYVIFVCNDTAHISHIALVTRKHLCGVASSKLVVSLLPHGLYRHIPITPLSHHTLFTHTYRYLHIDLSNAYCDKLCVWCLYHVVASCDTQGCSLLKTFSFEWFRFSLRNLNTVSAL